MDKMIRVVHVTTVHHPLDTRIYHKQCKTLADNGFEVVLITACHDDLANINKNIPVKIVALRQVKNRFLRMTLTVLEAYRAAKKLNARIYHFHDPELIPAGYLLKKADNIVIYDVHEDYVTSIKQKKYLIPHLRSITAGIFGFVEKVLTKKFAVCLAEKYYQERFPEGKCILNYPLLNKPQEIEDSPAGGHNNYLLYTGGVTEDRGAFIHARIPLLVDGVHVHFTGICSKDTAGKILNTAGEKSSHIEIDGIEKYVSREEIDRKYYERKWLAGLALFPPTKHYMKKELTKFFEYMYAGLPIICSNFPVWESFIKEYRCGIAVNPLSDKEIKDAVTYLKDNPEVRNEMGRNGRNAVLNELNWDKEGERLVRWYKGLIKLTGNY